MARKGTTTKLKIIQAATRMFIENGYSDSIIPKIAKELDIYKGNIVFYFPTKEHLLKVMVDELCDFQWKMMEEEAQEGISSLLAYCLELTTMAAMCETDDNARDLYIAAYSHQLSLDTIRKNDAKKAKLVFGEYNKDWTDKDFELAEIIMSGIEFAVIKRTPDSTTFEERLKIAITTILRLYNVPQEIIDIKIAKVMVMDYHKVGKNILNQFKEYIEQINEEALKNAEQ